MDSVLLNGYLNLNHNTPKSDFFRYLLMYKVGGVYLDIKSFAETPLKNIISYTNKKVKQ